MLSRLRLHLSTVFLWAGANLAPRELRPMLLKTLDAFTGIPGEVERGRTGGVIISGWSITLAGENLSRNQQKAAMLAAIEVRERHETAVRQVDPELRPHFEPIQCDFEIPLVPTDEPYVYTRTTPLPETSWRPTDPAAVETETALEDEYRLWCATNKLDWISADELLRKQGLTGAQRVYLVKFIDRWSAALEATAKEGIRN